MTSGDKPCPPRSILEKHLNARHAKLENGVTDLIGDDFHAEIKSAIGQLTVYNLEMPKPRLLLYLFGACDARAKNTAQVRGLRVMRLAEKRARARFILGTNCGPDRFVRRRTFMIARP